MTNETHTLKHFIPHFIHALADLLSLPASMTSMTNEPSGAIAGLTCDDCSALQL